MSVLLAVCLTFRELLDRVEFADSVHCSVALLLLYDLIRFMSSARLSVCLFVYSQRSSPVMAFCSDSVPLVQCSVSCEGGTQSREVFCTDGEARVDIALCGDEDIPSALQDCNEMECEAAGQ